MDNPNDPKKIENDIDDSLLDVVAEFGEPILDALLKDGYIKSLPAIGLLFSGMTTFQKVKQRTLLKKVSAFCQILLQDKSPQDIKTFIEEHKSVTIEGLTIEEHLAATIDSLLGVDSAMLASEFFRKLIEKKISLSDYARFLDILQRCNIFDILAFSIHQNSSNSNNINYSKAVGLGLYELEIGPYISSQKDPKFKMSQFGGQFYLHIKVRLAEIKKTNRY